MAMNTAGFMACVGKIAAAGRITQKQAMALLQEVSDRAEAMRATGKADPAVAAAKELAESWSQNAKQKERDVLLNARARSVMRTQVAEAGGARGAAQSLHGMMHYVAGATVNDSAESLSHGLARALIAPAMNKIETAGLSKVAYSGQLDDQFAEALWRKRGGTPDPSIKISQPAQLLADAFFPALQQSHARLNAAGANIGEAEDYVARTAWDARQLRRAAGPGVSSEAAFEAWWARERPRMAEATFRDLAPEEGQSRADAEEKFGRSVFFGRVTGVVRDSTIGVSGLGEGEDFVPPSYVGTRNIARKLSHQRVVLWKDLTSWREHMNEFGGGGSLYGQLVHSLQAAARGYALMTKFGTNPMANLKQVIEDTRKTYRNSDPDGVLKFDAQVPRLLNTMGRLDGSLNNPLSYDHAQLQRWAETAMTLEAEAHLGGVSLVHVVSAPFTLSAQLAHHGIDHWQAVGNVMRVIATPAAKGAERAAIAEAGGYIHGHLAALDAAMPQADAGVPGFVSWMGAKFMRLTTLPYFIDKLQANGIKKMLMSNLGHQADQPFAGLEPHVQAMLARYRIGEAEWDLIRQAPDPLTIEGIRYVTPADISRVSDQGMLDYLARTGNMSEAPQAITQARWDVADRLLMYFNDAAEHATVTPGVRERAMVLGELRPGSLNYMLRRFALQFKMWPLAAYHQIWLQNLGQSLSRLETAQNIGWIFALGTAAGALRMSINDAISGRPQQNYFNPITALRAFAMGGGLGIYGDFVAGEFNRMADGLISLGGPIVSDANRLIQIYQRFTADLEKGQGGKGLEHMWPELVRFGVGHIPFANLIYLKGALDYLLIYHIYAAIDPNWWERTNRRLLKEQGRAMLGYVPGRGVPWTPWGIGAQSAR